MKGVSVVKQGGKPLLSKFGQKEMSYSIPRAFINLILGSPCALLEVKPDGAYGRKDGYSPSGVLDKLGSLLVDTTVERSCSLGNSPNAVGKDKGNWKTLY